MTIIKWQNRPVLSNLFENFFDSEFPASFERGMGCAPATNIIEKEDQYEIQLVAPGLSKDMFSLGVENNVLTVSFEKKEERETKDKFLRWEYEAESFTRSFALPKNVDTDKIKAQYENGVLKIGVPREKPEKAKLSKQIKIS